jgi:O-antigen/teichoic acid export membrane protein
MGIKEQAINGVLWNAVGKISSMGIEFIVGILLARLLTPKEFGLIGTIMVFIAISQIFINSGFSQALVRKQDCTQDDYSTAFYFNIAVGLFSFAIILLSAGYISKFYNIPELKPLLQVLGIGLIISSFTIIQSAKLTKRLDFKLQTKISVIASILSGIIAVTMALKGFGVWSLVAKSLTNQAINSALLWAWNNWIPDFVFKLDSLKELFGFGSKLLLSGLIGTIFNNIYYVVIGKYFSVADLGFYTRAELFKNLPSQIISDVANNVGYPVLSKVQHEPNQLKEGTRKIITTTFFIVAFLMFGLAAVADSLVITLVGEKWRQSVIYLQMLCFVGLMYPLNSININILNVVGRSDLYLKLQLVSQVLIIPVVIVGIIYGIKVMIIGTCINSLLAYLYFGIISSRYSGYKFKHQLNDIFKPLLLALSMGSVVYIVGYLTNFKPLITLLMQISIGALIIIFFGNLLRLREYILIKTIIIEQYSLMKRK